MISRGYDKRFVYGLLAAGGTLGILIPPSIPMIVYGFITEESVGALFLAGVGPGIALVTLFILFSMAHARLTGQRRETAATWEERRTASLRALPSFALAALIIGGIYSGAFTPTEAAAVGFAAALVIVVFVLRSLTSAGFREAAFESMATTTAILLDRCRRKSVRKGDHPLPYPTGHLRPDRADDRHAADLHPRG